MTKKNYDFGEKAKENYKTKDGWTELEVWQTPRYLASKEKAIELIESGNYSLDTGDFWILKNQGGKKLCYTGLIISHNGCLKINDKLSPELKFKPSCVGFLRDAGEKDKVLSYINEEQGIYEFGEISVKNCTNDYPYAMLIKRLMDRVILKNSKVGFFGIYSESESDDFASSPDSKEESKKNAFGLSPNGPLANGDDMKELLISTNELSFAKIKKLIEECKSVDEINNYWESNKKDINKLRKYAAPLYELLVEAAKKTKADITS